MNETAKTETEKNMKEFAKVMEVYDFFFSGGQPLNDPTVIEFIRANIPFPVPYVSFVGRNGDVKIRFTRSLALDENLKQK